MALPLIFVPYGTRLWLAEGHSIAPQTVYDDVPMLAGHSRKRRTRTTAPRVAYVQTILEPDQIAAFDSWYEDTLRAGTDQFTAEIADLGPGNPKFWAARWVEPYTAEPMHLGRWRITGALLLSGTPSDTRPATGALALEIEIALGASAVATQPTLLALEIEIALTSVSSLALEIEIDLGVIVPDFILLEDDLSKLLLEDGTSRIQKE